MRAGEWHIFTLEGEGTRLVVPQDVLLFVNDSIVPLGVVQVQNSDPADWKNHHHPPYVNATSLTVVHEDGTASKN